MSETSHNKGDQDDRKRHRRSRKDGHQRTYVCSQCQKSYLSNAALYTHTKTKHQSLSQKSAVKEGEGGANQNTPYSQQVIQGVQNQEKQVQNNENGYNALEDLRNFMKRYFPERNRGSSVRLITQGLPPHIQQYIFPLLTGWEEKIKGQISKGNLKIDDVFGYYLTLMNIRVSSTCMNFFIRVFYYMREGLRIEHRRNLYCENESAYSLPNDFNTLVLNRRVPPETVQQDQLMSNSSIVCKVMEYFGNWLYEERLTDYKLIPKYPQN